MYNVKNTNQKGNTMEKNNNSPKSEQAQPVKKGFAARNGYHKAALALLIAVVLLVSVSCKDMYALPKLTEAGTYADIIIENYGVITVKLDAQTAPITVANFVKLANEGFYNGLTFHRIMEGFMMQGGDPKGNGTGGSDDKIKGEFSANGVENNISHKAGVISMARSGSSYESYIAYGYTVEKIAQATGKTVEEIQASLDNAYNSASSQFFIMHANNAGLDGSYAAFGYVVHGLEIVDKVCKDAEPTDSNGTISKSDQPVIRSISIREIQ